MAEQSRRVAADWQFLFSFQITFSFAIIEYLAEKFPQKAVWPKDARDRAHARSLCAEMHSGFQAFRQNCPTNFRRDRRATPREIDEAARADLARIEAIFAQAKGPFLFGAEGWKLVPGHFAERHGAIVIIALGESIVAIGAGASGTVGAGVVAAAVLGTIVVGALWWLYFDIVAIVAERRLSKATEGRERNEIARDSYSYLHFPMIAGIALVALGMKKTLAHVGDPLGLVGRLA